MIRSVRGFLVGVVLGLALSGASQAAHFWVVSSSVAEPYLSLQDSLRSVLEPRGHMLKQFSITELPREAPPGLRVIVSLGVEASERVASQSWRVPIIAVLVPRQWYLDGGRDLLTDAGRRQASAIFIDQPPERQAALLRLAFPHLKRVGLLVSRELLEASAEIESALSATQFDVIRATLEPGSSLIVPLEKVLALSDVLLALPDPRVLNPRTAQSFLLTSFRYRDPVVGYSRSLTTAGALMSLHSSPAEIGRQAAEWIVDLGERDAVRLPAPSYPLYFGISQNLQVARSLGVTLPAPESLKAALERLP